MSPKQKYFFSDEHDRMIRSRYDSRSETITAISRALRVPRWAVKKRAQQLGMVRCKDRQWSREEEEFLEASLPRLSLHTIARKLRRSLTAVRLKAKRLGLRKSDGAFTARAVALGFGVDDHAVLRWINGGLLKAQRRHSDRDHDMYFISDRCLREFVVKHPLEFDVRKVDQLWFIDLLTDGLRH